MLVPPPAPTGMELTSTANATMSQVVHQIHADGSRTPTGPAHPALELGTGFQGILIIKE